MMLPAIGGVSEPSLGTAPNPHLPTYNPTPLTHPKGGREGTILSSFIQERWSDVQWDSSGPMVRARTSHHP